MPRVATCNSCGARFKIPDNSKVKRAKCSSCGSVIEIPDADGQEAAGGSKPTPSTGKAAESPTAKSEAGSQKSAPQTAPRKAAGAPGRAPAKAPSAAPRKLAGRASPAGSPRKSAGAKPDRTVSRASGKRTSGAKASGRSGSRRSGSSGSSRRGGRKAAAGASDAGTNTGMLVGIGVVVLLLATGGWYFLSGDEQVSPATDSTNTTDSGTSELPATDDPGSTTADNTPPSDSDAASSTADDGRAPAPVAANDDTGDAAPAPAPALTSKTLPSEPLPTVIEFDLLPPVPGTTVEELTEWAAAIRELHVDFGGAAGRARTKLLKTVKSLDAITATPAYLNALIDADFANKDSVRGIGRLVADWQERVGYTPRFSYPVDPSRMDTKTQNLRVKVIQGWRAWWTDVRKSGQDEAVLEQYRVLVAGKLEKLKGK